MAAGIEPRITASANEVVAKRHGLTHWDRDRQQYVRPPESVEADEFVPVDTEGSDGTTEDDGYEPVDYSGWEYVALQAEARRRSLDATGKKADIVARLTEDDELAADEGDED
jgi:hypothetical protein